jgi:hypothetical protein
LLGKAKTPSIQSTEDAYILSPAHAAKFAFSKVTALRASIYTIAFISLAYSLLVFNSSEKLLTLGLLFAVGIFLYITQLMSIKAYSPIEKVNLILLSPVIIVFRIAFCAVSVIFTVGKKATNLLKPRPLSA